jgi:hypothetical protein
MTSPVLRSRRNIPPPDQRFPHIPMIIHLRYDDNDDDDDDDFTLTTITISKLSSPKCLSLPVKEKKCYLLLRKREKKKQ